jgi:hypothetical protein
MGYSNGHAADTLSSIVRGDDDLLKGDCIAKIIAMAKGL